MEQSGEWEERKGKGQDRWGISSPPDAKDTMTNIPRWNDFPMEFPLPIVGLSKNPFKSSDTLSNNAGKL